MERPVAWLGVVDVGEGCAPSARKLWRVGVGGTRGDIAVAKEKKWPFGVRCPNLYAQPTNRNVA